MNWKVFELEGVRIKSVRIRKLPTTLNCKLSELESIRIITDLDRLHEKLAIHLICCHP